MKPPVIRRFRCACPSWRRERGITMVLVALAMVAIIAMAALSIDIITLYLAREEAQRSADAAALAAARVISISGITGTANPDTDNSYWQQICGGSSSVATQAAQAVVRQNAVGGGAVATSSITVTYSAGSGGSIGSNANCSSLPAAFAVNPMVAVQIQQTGLPTFFSRIWGRSGNTVSATATAEAFNPSNSGNVGNQTSGTIIPVQPRCVKPWIIPNRDPLSPAPVTTGGRNPVTTYCDQTPQTDTTNQTGPACNTLVSTADGSITNNGISLNGGNPSSGVIGEQFWLQPDCIHTGQTCSTRILPPQGNYYAPSRITWLEPPPSLDYLPGEAPAATPVAVPSCASSGSAYEEAIAGCDQSTVYQCGVQSSSSSNPNRVNLNENPGFGTGDTMNGVQCLINQQNTGNNQPTGQDFLNSNGSPSSYPFQIFPGTNNPTNLASSTPITSSTSIVSLPIYDSSLSAGPIAPSGTTKVTIVGFLQVFINQVDQWGNINVTVLNVAGCSNGTGSAVGTAVTGSSPVPIRLITSP
jgi:Flp pilus assembly protein TadG